MSLWTIFSSLSHCGGTRGWGFAPHCPHPTPGPAPALARTHVDHVLPQLRPFHAGEEAQQQVHDGRGANVLQQQIHEVVLLPQEGHELRIQAMGERWAPRPTSPRSPACPAAARAPGQSCG